MSGEGDLFSNGGKLLPVVVRAAGTYNPKFWAECDPAIPNGDCLYWCAVDGVTFALKYVGNGPSPRPELKGKKIECWYRPTNRTQAMWENWVKKWVTETST